MGDALLGWVGRGWPRFRGLKWGWQVALWLIPIVPLWMFIGSRPVERRRGWLIAGAAATLLYGGVVVSSTADSEPGPPTTDVEAIAARYVARCEDGTYSDNTQFDDTCSSHDEVGEWLAPYGRCRGGVVIKMSTDADCGGDGFERLLAQDYRPQPGKDDVARCEDDTFSDNVDFGATCSSRGGVAEWLAAWGSCVDGTVIEMSESASCDGHDGFARLMAADFEPTAAEGDVAECGDGLFSDNTEFDDTCSDHDGVVRWLSDYGACSDGHVFEVDERASCNGHDGFDRLMPVGYRPPPTTTAPPTTTTTAPPPTTVPPTTAPPVTAPPVTAPPPPPMTVAPAPPSGGGCDSNYTPCVPIDSDVDCAGGSGNGPSYVSGPVTVIGTDVYGLDGNDNDGIGCE